MEYNVFCSAIATLLKKLTQIKGACSMNNHKIRTDIKENRLRQWEVAEKVGISDGRLSVWLRTPLNDDRKKRVENAIQALIKEG